MNNLLPLGKFLLIIVLASAPNIKLSSQQSALIDSAHIMFKAHNYPLAIQYLKQAEAENPNDADVQYYLGYYCHYLAYDSRPFAGYDIGWSDLVLQHLKKAISLKPDYGDAYYFLGAEYGGRARIALFERDMETCIDEYVLGRENGGFPDWLIEWGRNILKSCKPNAILFTAGDADLNAIHYLQFVENYRKDVSAFPYAMLDRPWFVTLMKQGIPEYIESVPIGWSDYEIMSMRPYKWKTNDISITYPRRMNEFHIESTDSIMFLTIEANLERGKGKYLSSDIALLANIIETNDWNRPIHFSLFSRYGDYLMKYFQICGLTYRLLPFNTSENNIAIDIDHTEKILLDKNSFQDLGTVLNSDMPRASHLLHGYRWIYLTVAEQYIKNGDRVKGEMIIETMHDYIPTEILPIKEYYTDMIDRITK